METAINVKPNNERRYDWQANHELIWQVILKVLQSEKRFPSYKEISMATGMSIPRICDHAKSLDLVEIRTQAKLLGPSILLKQAIAALNSGDHNEAKTYFKLNYDWAEKSETKVSGALDINATITVEKLEAEAAIIQDRLKRYAEGKLTEEQYEREMRGEVQEAVFEDVSTGTNVHVENGESESETA